MFKCWLKWRKFWKQHFKHSKSCVPFFCDLSCLIVIKVMAIFIACSCCRISFTEQSWNQLLRLLRKEVENRIKEQWRWRVKCVGRHTWHNSCNFTDLISCTISNKNLVILSALKYGKIDMTNFRARCFQSPRVYFANLVSGLHVNEFSRTLVY